MLVEEQDVMSNAAVTRKGFLRIIELHIYLLH